MNPRLGAGPSTSFTVNSGTSKRRLASLAEELVPGPNSSMFMERVEVAVPESAPAAVELGQYPPLMDNVYRPVSAEIASRAVSTTVSNLASIILLVTIGVITAGFVASAVATARYISRAPVYDHGDFFAEVDGDAGRPRDIPSGDDVATARDPPSPEDEAHKMRLMMQPAEAIKGPDSRPKTDSPRDVAGRNEVVD